MLMCKYGMPAAMTSIQHIYRMFHIYPIHLYFRFNSFWCVYRRNVDGIVFIYNQEDEIGVRKLDHMYNYFVSQPNRSLKTCLVCAVQAEENNARLCGFFFNK